MSQKNDAETWTGEYDSAGDDFDDDGTTCWACHGEGGYHDCGEDCCCCLDKDEITETCEECGGTGFCR
jgi:hypothetical protein